MNIVVAGDVHGAIGALYEKAHELQDKHGTPIDAILQVGDLQIYLGRPEVRELIERTQPRFVFFGHHYHHVEGMIGNTTVIGLAGVHKDGGLHVLRDL